MRVMIAGAAGFLGSHLTDALLAQGHDVLGVDNLCTGSLENLKHLRLSGDSVFASRTSAIPLIRSPSIMCLTSLPPPVPRTTCGWESKP